MEVHYRDIKNPKEEWSYLELMVKNEQKASLILLSGINGRFRIDGPAGPVCWGNMEQGCYGAWLLRNDNEWQPEQMPVPPISSADVEEAPEQAGVARNSYWAKFFARSLAKSACSPLYEGKWSITNQRQDIETSRNLLVGFPSEENKVGFYKSRPVYLDWGNVGNFGVYALKAMPSEHEGRVKWWRKKVREGQCPPVLIWFISCLQAYVVLDGHARLKATVLEGALPDFMVLKPLNELARIPDTETAERVQQDLARIQKQVTENLEKRQKHTWKQPLSVEKLNDILIQLYDTRPFVNHISRSRAVKDFENRWLKEVKAFSGRPGTDEAELDCMLNGGYLFQPKAL